MNASYVAPLSRERVRSIGLSATALAEVQYTRQLIREWLDAHPEEPRMYDVFEQLYMMEDAANTLAAERTGTNLTGDIAEIAA